MILDLSENGTAADLHPRKTGEASCERSENFQFVFRVEGVNKSQYDVIAVQVNWVIVKMEL